MKSAVTVPDYSAFLIEVKGCIQSARLNAGRAVNRELVMLYWDIERGIVEKQRWWRSISKSSRSSRSLRARWIFT